MYSFQLFLYTLFGGNDRDKHRSTAQILASHSTGPLGQEVCSMIMALQFLKVLDDWYEID